MRKKSYGNRKGKEGKRRDRLEMTWERRNRNAREHRTQCHISHNTLVKPHWPQSSDK